jgi:signal transduction histidine kinase
MKNDLSILLVDDEVKISNKLSRILSRAGYHVETTENGAEAVKKLEKSSFDIVMTDLNMPEMNGYELMKYIRENKIETLPLVLTGYASMEGAIKAMKYGAYDFIQKPVDAATLKLTINRAAERILLKRENLNHIKQLKKLNDLKSEYLAIVSHDIRSPLSSIGAYANYLLKKGELSELQQRYLLIIKDLSDHLYFLVNEILDISKIEIGIMDLHIELIDIEDLINLCLNSFILLGVDKNIMFEFHNKLSDNYLSLDKMKIIQVLNNLINNAIKFTEHGKVIITTESKGKNKISITVKDTGIGISTKEMNSLFNEYSLSHKKGTRGETGNGLGLVICKKFIELHDGEIKVSSKIGKGTIFTIILPRRREDDQSEK